MLLQVYGLRYTLPSVSSFLTALPIFAPVAQSIVMRRRVGGIVWLSVGIAVVGIGVLAISGTDATTRGPLVHRPPIPFFGEILTILGAMMFAAEILCVDRFGQHANASRLTVVMLLTAGFISLAIGLAAGGGALQRPSMVNLLIHDGSFTWSLTGLVVFSSVLALQLMNMWQPRIAPATATVVYCLEPVFGTVFSVMFGTESLTASTIVGGAIILCAVLTISQKPGTSPHAVTAAALGVPLD
jgi:drug/metabolite transporter (DMT)-like permease